MLPDAHVVLPVQFAPPHCPYKATALPEEAAVDVVLVLEVVFVHFLSVVLDEAGAVEAAAVAVEETGVTSTEEAEAEEDATGTTDDEEITVEEAAAEETRTGLTAGTEATEDLVAETELELVETALDALTLTVEVAGVLETVVDVTGLVPAADERAATTLL